jgi:hypothetical protein
MKVLSTIRTMQLDDGNSKNAPYLFQRETTAVRSPSPLLSLSDSLSLSLSVSDSLSLPLRRQTP